MRYRSSGPGPEQSPKQAANAIVVPSGDHAGEVAFSPRLSLVTLPVVTSTTKMASPSTASFRQNASLVPSGDHVRSYPWTGASSRTSVPSAFIRKIRPFTSLSSRQNAICRPSGDHAGSASPPPTVSVNRVAPVPSAFITQICPSREKAILAPSGDHAGDWLYL